MSLIIALYASFLFFVLTPSVLVRLPKNGNKFTVAGIHALVFGVVFYFTSIFVSELVHFEGFGKGKVGDCPGLSEDSCKSTTGYNGKKCTWTPSNVVCSNPNYQQVGQLGKCGPKETKTSTWINNNKCSTPGHVRIPDTTTCVDNANINKLTPISSFGGGCK
uniref:Uncharacterized protein n=1 Tax=viral metagenome TaxID=1070528 RepID=A0A6C0B730_9ZZZZ